MTQLKSKIFIIKLNDSKNGLSSSNLKYKQKAIYIHKLIQKYNIKITDFDYTPDFGINNEDWVDSLHWIDDFYIRWSNWIINKIKLLLYYNKIKYSSKKRY